MLLLCLSLLIGALLAASILLERKLERRHFGTSYEECERELYLEILEDTHTQRIVGNSDRELVGRVIRQMSFQNASMPSRR